MASFGLPAFVGGLRAGGVGAGLVIAGFGVAIAGSACSSNECSDSECAKGNICLDDGETGTQCRLLCATQTECPFGYHCGTAKAPPGGTAPTDKTFCLKDAVQYQKKEAGQFGASCGSQGGLDQNPDCDAEQYFWCFGASPTDGDAYCTQYQCTTDAECPGGYFCGTVNELPNVTTEKAVRGVTTTVCQKREYCAPCQNDVDCLPIDGQKAWCAEGADGKKFCTTECTSDANCRQDAKCEAAPELGGGSVCKPRAGVCVGDGTLCAPCRSDADCPEGACLSHPYSPEKFCTVKSKSPCKIVDQKLQADCPKENQAGARIGCFTQAGDEGAPKDHCIGIVSFGQSSVPGCWTVSPANRN